MSDATRKFKMIPDQEELDQMERDLSFYPSKVTSPKILSNEQVEHFNREGYVRPIPIFDDAEIKDIRSYFDELLNRVIAEGGDSYSISSAHLKYGRVYDLLKHPKIVACVTDILGENVVGWGSHFFCKMPHDGKAVAWHQDASYWPLSPSKALTVWLAIDDADIENACMKFVSGSHHVGHLTYRPSDSGEHNVLNQTVEDPEQYGAVAYDELKAGQISLHSDLLLHGSEANNSDRRRCGLTLRYAACDVHAAMNWNEKGVLVNGQDASGHWANRERPQND
ncbi:phytanoyl-CoA dioxygenase family protein [Thalassoglobus polymorphus]|uniref:Phytanoyl-CoA dioxygenase (PhyH) n=1 Tax=Thalassoglobus polymorphus TaxID=2527994 RepID=A0A517QGY8_9PLAN|nr:phytanoyl-CoA dioxygenase family protein [Thalassoglobus polymorphus]QDT30817.1 Phytanoyl-CoA dioxygenase (PhyH) [Thalassoglobus polymorphus]